MSTRWNAPRECPDCGWAPYDPEEDTCPNPTCDRHWSREIPEPEARTAALRGALRQLAETTRRTR